MLQKQKPFPFYGKNMEEDESMNEASEMLEKDSTENRFVTLKTNYNYTDRF